MPHLPAAGHANPTPPHPHRQATLLTPLLAVFDPSEVTGGGPVALISARHLAPSACVLALLEMPSFNHVPPAPPPRPSSSLPTGPPLRHLPLTGTSCKEPAHSMLPLLPLPPYYSAWAVACALMPYKEAALAKLERSTPT